MGSLYIEFSELKTILVSMVNSDFFLKIIDFDSVIKGI